MSNLILLIYDHSKLLTVFLIYLLTLNILSFVLMLVDKYKAQNNHWRVKEWTFVVLSISGGSIGVLIGMVVFRHKTSKKKFYIGIPIIYLANIAVIYMILNRII